ncbi:hypothetical protein CRG98_005496 [Punica granatum]|uniref:Uncharacterized protein n=1 Tax=Punica granatum TaxID=22663 RepID=A0A2I0L080_PUNGR|nr:hypothetical protein CRG98_005496 [Punica granatum]
MKNVNLGLINSVFSRISTIRRSIRTTNFECATNRDPSFLPVSPHEPWGPRAAQEQSPLSAPHFGPPASHTRIPDRSPRHYSSPGHQRQIGGHGVMSNRRGARSTEKGGREQSEERTDKESRKRRSCHCGTIHHRVTEAPKDDFPKRAYRHPGTTKVREQAPDDLPELDSISRGTLQWSRTFPGKPSGHVYGRQGSQRSPTTSQRSPSASRHSENTEKIPAKVPRSSRANDPRPKATSQRSSTGQKDRQNEC